MRVDLIVGLALGMTLAAGCGGGKMSSSKSLEPAAPAGATATSGDRTNQALIVTPAGGMTGKVALSNPEARYVVLSFPLGTLPPADKRLGVYRNGLKVGEVRVSGPNRDNNTVADLVAGEARRGDEVRDN